MQRGLADQQLQTRIVLHAARLTSWELVRCEVQAALTTRQAISSYQGPAPMEIGYIGKKGKEKGNTTNSTSDADKECFYCKGKGHIARNCRKRIADEKAKAGQQSTGSESRGQRRGRVNALTADGSGTQQQQLALMPPMPSTGTSPHQIAALYAQMVQHAAAQAATQSTQRQAPL